MKDKNDMDLFLDALRGYDITPMTDDHAEVLSQDSPYRSEKVKTIHIYRHNGQWVFDDPRVELDKEPFVMGMDDIIDFLTKLNGVDPKVGFTAEFSDEEIEHTPDTKNDSIYRLRKLEDHPDDFGAWYELDMAGVLKMKGWLCPATLFYFAKHPQNIWLRMIR